LPPLVDVGFSYSEDPTICEDRQLYQQLHVAGLYRLSFPRGSFAIGVVPIAQLGGSMVKIAQWLNGLLVLRIKSRQVRRLWMQMNDRKRLFIYWRHLEL
jgi:hypothetical protein